MLILIVDDEDDQRQMLSGFLQKKGYHVMMAASGTEALACFQSYPVQLVLLDHRMPDMTGDQVLAKLKTINPLIRCIMITAFGSVETAVNVMKLGADDFMEKPVDLLILLEKIQMFEQRIHIDQDVIDVSDEIKENHLPVRMIGDGHAMKEVISLVRRIAPTPYTVLIQGETGTGKELIARLIHVLSDMRDGPFIEVNCGAIPENLFESELFGHEKGAFTGANASRRGRFEMAQGGVLFLDEIGELPLNLQPKLLRAIQEKKICRIGSEKEIVVNIRLVTATNRDLKALVDQGQFREDLYYRLNVFEIELPPLRQRKEDIPALVDFFIDRYSKRPIQFDSNAMTTLIKYPFPGNVRELEHMIQRTVTLCRSSIIQSSDLPTEVRFYRASEQGTLVERLEALEQELIVSALEKNNWVQTRAAQSLDISERVLRYKMKKYSITSHKLY